MMTRLHLPRRVMNGAVIVGGIVGIVLQAHFGWGAVTTFVITLGLCALSVALVAVVYRVLRSH